MEKNPYTFDASNSRIVTNAEQPSLVATGAAAIFVGSLYLYNRRFFRIDNNIINATAFAVASAPASYAYANTLFNSATNEAGLLNNQRETQH